MNISVIRHKIKADTIRYTNTTDSRGETRRKEKAVQIEKAQKFFEDHNGSDLTVQDINAIKAEAETKSGGSALDVLWNAIWFAFVIGWGRGYRTAKRKAPASRGSADRDGTKM